MVDHQKKNGPAVHNLSLHVAQSFVKRLKDRLGQEGSRIKHSDVDPMQQWELQFLDYMQAAVTACAGGVARIHLVSRHIEGSIITELCTR
jgi:acetylglutamate kinase